MGIITAAAMALTVGVALPSDGLKTLAETGWADDYAAEVGGTAYDEIGGSPLMFDYAVDTPWQATAMELLGEGEFLAPHFADVNGIIVLMVAPHLFVDGELMKGANPQKDNFIVVYQNGSAERFDYSDDVANLLTN